MRYPMLHIFLGTTIYCIVGIWQGIRLMFGSLPGLVLTAIAIVLFVAFSGSCDPGQRVMTVIKNTPTAPPPVWPQGPQ